MNLRVSEKKENIAFGDLVYSVFKMSFRGVKKSKDCLGQKKITSFYCQEPKRDGGSEIGQFNFDQAVERWGGLRNRKILI